LLLSPLGRSVCGRIPVWTSKWNLTEIACPDTEPTRLPRSSRHGLLALLACFYVAAFSKPFAAPKPNQNDVLESNCRFFPTSREGTYVSTKNGWWNFFAHCETKAFPGVTAAQPVQIKYVRGRRVPTVLSHVDFAISACGVPRPRRHERCNTYSSTARSNRNTNLELLVILHSTLETSRR
jgi:hypothetical protein